MFENLLSPGRIGGLQIRNRIWMAPMGSNLAQSDGHLGERIKRYYEERARGGAGLLVVGVGAIAFPAGACNPNQVAISDDVYLPGLRDLTERVHAHGAKIAIQLQHAGKVAVRDIVDGRPMWVPSELPFKAGDLARDLTPDEMREFVGPLKRPGARMSHHVMTRDDIATLVDLFAAAGERAQRAGFDGVELHAGHGYILSSFLSPATNRREDEYGGSLENRARLLVEVIRALKARLGDEYPVWCRIDAKEFRTPGGISEEDARRTAGLAEQAGADAIHVSAYADSSSGRAFTDAPLVHEPGGYVELAAAIKRRVGIPVIAVGRIEPEQADALVRDGHADFVAMARKLLADPELPRKLKAGRPRDVRPCIYCYTCVGNIFLNRASACAVNPASGREAELPIEPTSQPRKVLVVGGGPAGMEAARILALRGHRVTLCEKGDRLGGTAFFSALVYPPNGRLVEWLETQVRALPITLQLGREVSAETVEEIGPDVTLVAVGARRRVPAIPGVDARHVLSGDDLRGMMAGGDRRVAVRKLRPGQRALLGLGGLLRVGSRVERSRQLTRLWMPVGRRVAIVGGGLVGVELAEFLVERGREVVVLEEGPSLAAEMAPPRRWRVLSDLREHGAVLRTGVRTLAIEADAVVCTAISEPEARERVPADCVILAVGTEADARLADAIAARGREVHRLGDCDDVGYLQGAMESAARIARQI